MDSKSLIVPRMGLWLYASIALLAALYLIAPHMAQVVLFKLCLITVAAWLGYWISRALERGRRPHELKEHAFQHRENGRPERADHLEARAELLLLRRTIIVAAAMIAAALGG